MSGEQAYNAERGNGPPSGRGTRILLVALIAILVLFGGHAQYALLVDVPLRVGVFAIAAWWIATGRLRTTRFGWLEIAVLAGILFIPALQLVPLPPSVWTAMPGRGVFAEAYRAIGGNLPALSINVAPERGRDALIGLVVPIGCYLIGRTLRRDERLLVVMVLVGAALVSAVLGLLQVGLGEGSVLRFYRITNATGALGFFANRNHLALFLAMALPLAAWTATVMRRRPGGVAERSLFVGVGAVLVVGAVLSFSRAGALFALAAAVASALLIAAPAGTERRPRWLSGALIAGTVAIVLALVLATTLADRFAELEGDNARGDIVPALIQAARAGTPVGFGVGSFEQVFPQFEKVETLTPAYWNQAHNDYAQLLIETGVFGAAVLLLFLFWWLRLLRSVVRPTDDLLAPDRRLVGVVLFATGLVLIHSAVDYPLRTGTLAGMFAILCGMAESVRRHGSRAWRQA